MGVIGRTLQCVVSGAWGVLAMAGVSITTRRFVEPTAPLPRMHYEAVVETLQRRSNREGNSMSKPASAWVSWPIWGPGPSGERYSPSSRRNRVIKRRLSKEPPGALRCGRLRLPATCRDSSSLEACGK